MARVLIVGCGCRGRALAGKLIAAGHVVRGTTREPERTAAIAAAGAEPYVGDPDRVGTLTGALDAVTVVCWLMGSASGEADDVIALHGPRWEAFLSKIVDTTVRGVVYETGRTVPDAVRENGRALAEIAARTWEIPIVATGVPPAEHARWTAEMADAVGRLLGGPASPVR